MGRDSAREGKIDIYAIFIRLSNIIYRQRISIQFLFLKDLELQIFYRKNVNKTWPEGSLWVCVPTKEGSESRYIDCGPSGSVWVVLWSGVILVRKQVSAETPQGRYNIPTYFVPTYRYLTTILLVGTHFIFLTHNVNLNIIKVNNGLLLNLRKKIQKLHNYQLGSNQCGQLLTIPECGIEKE